MFIKVGQLNKFAQTRKLKIEYTNFPGPKMSANSSLDHVAHGRPLKFTPGSLSTPMIPRK